MGKLSLMGYTPLFDTLTEGSLCGRWPDIGLWPVLLSMTDWRGHIDKTPHYISMVTGLSQAEVAACLARFCAPDQESRSRTHEGARLTLIDPERTWGWKVVNIQIYRDRASGHDQVSDGRNAEKVRRYKERNREDTDGHQGTPANTHSDSNTYSDSNKEKRGERSQARATRLPDDFSLTPERTLVAEAEKLPAERVFAKFCDHWRSASGARARKVDWDATWRNWCRNEVDRGNGKTTAKFVAPPDEEVIRA